MENGNRIGSRGARATLRSLAVLSLAAVLYAPSLAHAGGFWITDRGARPMSRGFAFVAGADDPQSLWYNPAGLGWSGKQLMLDASYMFFDGTYARVDSAGNQLPPVDINSVPLPIPGGALSVPLNDEFTIGAGVFAPNALLLDYDDYYAPTGTYLDQSGAPCDPAGGDPTCRPQYEACNPEDGDIDCVAPQRYSLQTMKGSALAMLALAAAWRPREELSIGFGAHIIAGSFQAETTLTGCDGAICTRNENPEVDGYARLTVFPVFDVGPTAGITYDAGPIRIAGSFLWWPRAIQGTAHMDVRIPSSPLFTGARVEGDEAKVSVPFPLQVRLGVEVQPVEQLRIEAALVWERWSTQKAITFEPQNVWIRDVVAVGDYQVGPVSIPRYMNDVWSVRLGGSFSPLPDGSVLISAGANYENSSFDDEYLTALTIDSRKIVAGGGVSARVMEGVWFDVSFAHVFMRDPNVTNSAVPQANAIRPPQSPGITAYVGNGQYTMEANIVAAGLRYQWGEDDEDAGDATPGLPPGPAPAPTRAPELYLDEAAPSETTPAPAAATPASTEEPPTVDAPDQDTVVGEEPPIRPARRPRRLRTASDTVEAPAAPAEQPTVVGEEPPPQPARHQRRRRTESDPNPYR